MRYSAKQNAPALVGQPPPEKLLLERGKTPTRHPEISIAGHGRAKDVKASSNEQRVGLHESAISASRL